MSFRELMEYDFDELLENGLNLVQNMEQRHGLAPNEGKF